ncbi:MAG: radical SAM protein [Chitinivibrionia bacterium]|nr:radical SAM protein [Chitinivibrionia bacterium]
MRNDNSIIFGPVQSRRLGSSLGLDLVTAKTCSLDCVYCECGKTTNLTNERREYIFAEKVIADLDAFLQNEPPHIDVITLGGSGEPLLNSGAGKIISHIKKTYPQFKVAVLTNSVSLIEKEAREEILPADFVLPSVDAFFEESFQKINRPAKNVTVNFVLDGLREFSKIYKGTLWVEYFVISGINDGEKEVLSLKKYFEEIKPTKVQLNSLDRPGTCEWVKATQIERLQEIKNILQPLSVEIISRNYDAKRRESRELANKFISRQEK